MNVLMPNDIKELLKIASEKLTESRDREMMDRLIPSLDVTDIADWDRRLIGTMLAKAGMVEDCEKVASGMASKWEKADAMRSAGAALLECGREEDGLKLLASAVSTAQEAQDNGTDTDRQCAAAVLADVSETYAARGDYDTAETVINSIQHSIRQSRAMERLYEMRPPVEEPTLEGEENVSVETGESVQAEERSNPPNGGQATDDTNPSPS